MAGLSRRFSGFAPSLCFQVSRAAMAHIAVVLVAALVRAVFRRDRVPIRIGQVAPAVSRVKRVAAMYASPELGLGSHIRQDTRDGLKSGLILASQKVWRAAKVTSWAAGELHTFSN
jgi:hypothetical protein